MLDTKRLVVQTCSHPSCSRKLQILFLYHYPSYIINLCLRELYLVIGLQLMLCLLDKSLPTNYRPISLTSIVIKVMEKIICRKMTFALEKSSNSQFGNKRSTVSFFLVLSMTGLSV